MSNYSSTNLQFFETGYIIINSKPVIGLKDIKVSWKNNTADIQNFDQNRIKNSYVQNSEWSASASGDFFATNFTGKTNLSWAVTGDSRITATSSATNGAQLLESAKGTTPVTVVMKLGPSIYQTGSALITNFEYSGSAGENLQFSLELKGLGTLSYSTT